MNTDEAASWLSKYGPNRLPEATSRGPVRRLLAQFHNALINLLLGAAVVTSSLPHWVDTGVILTVVLVNCAGAATCPIGRQAL